MEAVTCASPPCFEEVPWTGLSPEGETRFRLPRDGMEDSPGFGDSMSSSAWETIGQQPSFVELSQITYYVNDILQLLFVVFV